MLLTVVIIVAISILTMPASGEQLSDSTPIAVNDISLDSKKIIWKLPASPTSIESDFAASLSVAGQYQFAISEPIIVRQILQTSYVYPVSVMLADKQVAEVKVEFRHIDNGDVVYFITAYRLDSSLASLDVLQIDSSKVDTYQIDYGDDDLYLVWEVMENAQSIANEQLINEQLIADDKLYYITYDEPINNATSRWTSISAPKMTDSNITASSIMELPKAAIFTEHMRFGMVDVFTSLDNNVFAEQFDKAPATSIAINDTGRTWTATLPLYIEDGQQLLTEHWGILAANQLTSFALNEYNEVMETGMHVGTQDIRIADLDRFRKLRMDGIYYEVPSSYTPYQPMSYWQVPAEHIGARFIRSIKEQEAIGVEEIISYLETLSIISLNHNLQQQTADGYWITSPQSNWLFEDYGVEAGFYDTRFSTDAALFLLDIYQYYTNEFEHLLAQAEQEQALTQEQPAQLLILELEDELERILTAVTRYADFLVWYANQYSFITENGGLLVQDYIHPTITHQPTHVSLNHLVTEMNFLLLYSEELHARNNKSIGSSSSASSNNSIDNNIDNNIDNTYVETAAQIRQAVHDTNMAWVKDNNDLWYAYMPDGTYGLLDYPRLTRNDLRLSVSLIDQVWKQDDLLFRGLIFYKEKYLQENGIPLW